MKVIIVGCGRVGAELAYRLYLQEHQVAIIDAVPAAFENLPADFRGRIVEGDGLAQDVLHRAGIAEADGLVAATNSDSLNAVVAHVARSVYRVSKVVVRNYDAHWLALHEAFSLPVVSSTIWGAQRIEALLQQEAMRPLISLGNGEVNLYEVVVPPHWQGQPVQSLFPADKMRVVALSRAGHALLPAPEFALQAGDVVHFSTIPAHLAALQRQLNVLA